MLSFLPTGLIALAVYAKHGSVRWPLVGWLCLGAVPSAYLGAVSLPYISAELIMALIAGLMIVTGSDALRKSMRKTQMTGSPTIPGSVQFVVIGAITGYGSAISGTGGPLILVPILLYLGLPVKRQVALLAQSFLPGIKIFAQTREIVSEIFGDRQTIISERCTG